MTKPLVSVCCLTYNHENYIRECLDGFIIQKTNFAFEVLIHDDASTDETADIIREYEVKYPNIIKPIYQTENQYSKGVKPTFEFNFPRAKGKYIAMCEGDDYWIDPLKLQKQVDFLEENEDYTFSMGRVDMLIDKTGEIKKRKEIVNVKKEYLTLKDYLKGPISQTSSFVFRNDTKPFPDWFSKIHAGDQSLVIIKTGVNGKIKYHEECLSVYRRNIGSITNDNSYKEIAYYKSIETLKTWNYFLNRKYKSIIKLKIIKQKLSNKVRKISNRYFRRICEEVILKSYFIVIKFL